MALAKINDTENPLAKILRITEGYECRCDCANCVMGDHFNCYYWPTPICCPFVDELMPDVGN